ncbi:winged helix-turn-helix domain-containing protein [Arcanobacterium hippocoleae]
MRTTPPPIGTGSLLAAMQQLSPANHAMLRYLSGMVKPMTIAQIAQDQDLHQNSVRESIEALYAAGLIERSKVGSASRGRPAWAYYSIAPKTDAVFGVYVSKFACAISEMFRMKSDNPKSLAYTLGAYWAGELDEIAAAEARG